MFGKEKNEKLLSVIIPSYNHERFIAEAIESVLKQSYKNIELIIVDDGSSDNSVNIIKGYDDQRIKIVCQENAGAHNAINKGMELSKGEYIAILNSDDVYEKKRFDIMIDEMEKQDAYFACTYIQVIDSNGKKLGIKEGWRNMEPWQIEHPDKSFKATNDFKLNLLMANFTSTTSNFLFKREVYDKIGGMRNLRFAHDWDFALRAAEYFKCIIIEKPLIKYRIHNNNTISSNRKWMLFEIAWIWAANLERFYNNEAFIGNDIKLIEEIAESINLQGNDKVFWMIKIFIETQKSKGIDKPEEILLNDEKVRNKIIEYVVD